MLAARLGTAAVLIAGILAALFFLPAGPLLVLVAAIMAAGGYEWARLCGLSATHGFLFSGLVAVGVVAPALAGVAYAVVAIGAAFWVVVAPLWLARGMAPSQRRLLLAAGVAVLVPAGAALHVMTPLQVVLAVALTSIADSAAYFTGRAFGRRKLAPSISPGKTWEGVYGAVAATLVFAIACHAFVPQLRSAIGGIAWVPYLLAAATLCALGIAGDLFESALKRQAGAKDSGTLLPGHGGVLDRIDSATSTLPFAAGLWALIGGRMGT
ncbi:MAG TPA: phosphatidate cytidylyltransferase [Burkholderiales bacterium]|nr:phosphatidate cytidylyltransferase [Burkholderiales bacterium]